MYQRNQVSPHLRKCQGQGQWRSVQTSAAPADALGGRLVAQRPAGAAALVLRVQPLDDAQGPPQLEPQLPGLLLQRRPLPGPPPGPGPAAPSAHAAEGNRNRNAHAVSLTEPKNSARGRGCGGEVKAHHRSLPRKVSGSTSARCKCPLDDLSATRWARRGLDTSSPT